MRPGGIMCKYEFASIWSDLIWCLVVSCWFSSSLTFLVHQSQMRPRWWWLAIIPPTTSLIPFPDAILMILHHSSNFYFVILLSVSMASCLQIKNLKPFFNKKKVKTFFILLFSHVCLFKIDIWYQTCSHINRNWVLVKKWMLNWVMFYQVRLSDLISSRHTASPGPAQNKL